MWNDLRPTLERWGLLAPMTDRLTVRGRVLPDPMNADPARLADEVLLSVTIGDGKRTLMDVRPDGRFRLDLPMHQVVRLTIARQGHLPRMVELQPLRSTLRFSRSRMHFRCDIEVTLTPRQDAHGAPARPLLERITMPKDRRPLIVEWDYVMHAEQHEAFVPLFARVV